jgi:hypothetical protein
VKYLTKTELDMPVEFLRGGLALLAPVNGINPFTGALHP